MKNIVFFINVVATLPELDYMNLLYHHSPKSQLAMRARAQSRINRVAPITYQEFHACCLRYYWYLYRIMTLRCVERAQTDGISIQVICNVFL